jgi:hypothetical protein
MSGRRLHLIETTIDNHNNYHRRSYVYQCDHLVQVLLCRMEAVPTQIVIFALENTAFRPQILGP